MGKILDGLKRRERNRAHVLDPQLAHGSAIHTADRRRSQRRRLDVPVYIYANEPDKGPFHEETYTLDVNAQGALLLLSVPVREGQTLLLTNALTQQDQDCRIVRLGTRRSRTVEAGVTFPYPNASFWQPSKTKHVATR